MARVLLPLPALDFDPTEVAVTWAVLSSRGHDVRFATPSARPARADDLMVSGRGLDPWSVIPGLAPVVGVGRLLRADANGRRAYAALTESEAFGRPLGWSDIDVSALDGLVLAGGHRARGMRPYLESKVLQDVVVGAFRRGLAVGAVCHGVLLAARSVDGQTGRSVLHGRRTTALTWTLERKAWRVGRISRFWDPDYYRTYTEARGEPPGYMSVQQEVTRALASPDDFLDVDPKSGDASLQSSGRAHDTVTDERPAFVVEDGTYVSARWPGDIHTFARRFAGLLEGD